MNLRRPAQVKAGKELDLTPPLREATVTLGSGIDSPVVFYARFQVSVRLQLTLPALISAIERLSG